MKISMVTVTYNSEKTVRETFDSVLKQTYRPLQYVIVDGLSSDGTMDIVKEYEPRFLEAGIEFSCKSEKDKGISDAFNKGIGRADGDVIGLINSDDMLADGALEIVAAAYEEETAVYYGNCIIIREDGDRDDKYIVTPKENLDQLYRNMCIYHPACFVSKRAYDEFGGYDVDLRYCMDRELLLRFYVNGCIFKYIPESLAIYREGGVNQKMYKKNVREGCAISIKYGMDPFKARVNMYYKLAKTRVWRMVQAVGAEKFFHKKFK